MVWTRGGSSPLSPRASRSSMVKAVPLFMAGSRIRSKPVGKLPNRFFILILAAAPEALPFFNID